MALERTSLTLTTVYDNYVHRRGLKEGFGFSCLARAGDISILFDTGAEPKGLLYNMGRLGVEPGEIDIVFLSHAHGDHTGGLEGLLKARPGLKVYLPKSFPDGFKKKVKSSGSGIVEVSGPGDIYRGVFTTGELGTSVREQSLVISTEKGLVIVTGCAHPGIVSIVNEARRFYGEGVYLVLGGFHLKDTGDAGVKAVISSFRKMGVKRVAPCHCTGDRARELFSKEYGRGFIPNGAGMVIEI
jgi:7,8-dihydropterin-6-yl-methyl-4-(beta-D-ribofuranosyl)aminobenzene 5'-phosphate synthase